MGTAHRRQGHGPATRDVRGRTAEVRPPVRQVIGKVAVVHRPIRTCERFVRRRVMLADRPRLGAVGQGLKNPSHTVTEHHGSEHADRRFRVARDAKGYKDNRAQKLSSVRMTLLTINDYFQADSERLNNLADLAAFAAAEVSGDEIARTLAMLRSACRVGEPRVSPITIHEPSRRSHVRPDGRMRCLASWGRRVNVRGRCAGEGAGARPGRTRAAAR